MPPPILKSKSLEMANSVTTKLTPEIVRRITHWNIRKNGKSIRSYKRTACALPKTAAKRIEYKLEEGDVIEVTGLLMHAETRPVLIHTVKKS